MPSTAFSATVPRLLGVHDLTATQAAKLLGVSPQALSDWANGKRRPRLDAIMTVSEFFEIPVERLLKADFADLLAHELSDKARYQRVERKVTQAAG
jgi:transcriptional regulator with XRE-family HTH domain